MAENNSLSDLMNDHSWVFNDLITKRQFQQNSDLATQNAQLQAQKASLQTQIQQANNDSDKAALQTQLDSVNAQIGQNSIGQSSMGPQQNLNHTNQSLFDNYALLDYGRYNISDPWTDYKKDSNGNFLLNNTSQKLNQPVQSSSEIPADGMDPLFLCKWSEKYPSLQLRSQDFVFCKRLGYYPNNRLIVLRRFKNGVPDNLFDFHTKTSNLVYNQPISTLVSWVKPEESFVKINFNEVWTNKEGNIFSSLNQIKAETLPSKDSKHNDGKDKLINTDLFNLFDSSLFYALLDFAGLSSVDGVSKLARDPQGNPNLVRNAAFRQTGGNGLKSSIHFENLVFEYELRYIQGVDPSIAMLDLISNCFRMGTSVSEFRLGYDILQKSNIQNMLNNEFQLQLQNFINSLNADFFQPMLTSMSDFMNNLTKSFTSAASNTTISGALSTAATYIVSRYREAIRGAISAETGLPSGIWHVTIGNPLNPIISCGDMIITGSTLELGKELGYNDFPTSFKYTITLESARERGSGELQKIFNSGRGRSYVYTNISDTPDYNQYDPNGISAAQNGSFLGR